MTRSSLLVVVLLGLLPGPVASQDFEPDPPSNPPAPGRIVGRVTEEGRPNRGISGVEVTVIGPARVATLTNGGGRFDLRDLEPGRVEIRFTHLGYAPRTTTLIVQSGITVEVNAPMSTQPIALEGIAVTVRSRYLERVGFYRRSLRGGRQFTSADIDAMNAVYLSDLFFRVPGVTARYGLNGAARAVNRRGRSFRNPYGCTMPVYLDHVRQRDFDLDGFNPWNFDAVEVYVGINTPVEYGGMFNTCGVILLWTKR